MYSGMLGNRDESGCFPMESRDLKLLITDCQSLDECLQKSRDINKLTIVNLPNNERGVEITKNKIKLWPLSVTGTDHLTVNNPLHWFRLVESSAAGLGLKIRFGNKGISAPCD